MNDIAVCIPTYGHAEVVDDVLEKCLSDYFACEIDVYYYDSSEDDKTGRVIEKYQKMGFDNLYHIKLSSDLGVDKKVELIFEGTGLKKNYKYIWPAKDRSYCPQETLECIKKTVLDEYDIIFLGVTNVANGIEIKTTTYEDAKLFYRDWAWLATSLDVIIYRRETMLSDFTVDGFEKQYMYDYNIYWCAYTLLFNKIAMNPNLKVRLLRDEDIVILNSALGKSSWQKDIFKIWQEYWIKANEGLPACYEEYKGKVIKEATSLPWILGSISSLIELRKLGVLTIEVFEKIKEDWEKVSNVPLATVKEIALGIYNEFHDLNCLKGKGEEVIDVLVDISTMLKEGRLPKEQLPFDDIQKYILGTASKKNLPQEALNIILGSMMDLKQFILCKDTGVNDAVKAMQIYISYFFFL